MLTIKNLINEISTNIENLPFSEIINNDLSIKANNFTTNDLFYDSYNNDIEHKLLLYENNLFIYCNDLNCNTSKSSESKSIYNESEISSTNVMSSNINLKLDMSLYQLDSISSNDENDLIYDNNSFMSSSSSSIVSSSTTYSDINLINLENTNLLFNGENIDNETIDNETYTENGIIIKPLTKKNLSIFTKSLSEETIDVENHNIMDIYNSNNSIPKIYLNINELVINNDIFLNKNFLLNLNLNYIKNVTTSNIITNNIFNRKNINIENINSNTPVYILDQNYNIINKCMISTLPMSNKKNLSKKFIKNKSTDPDKVYNFKNINIFDLTSNLQNSSWVIKPTIVFAGNYFYIKETIINPKSKSIFLFNLLSQTSSEFNSEQSAATTVIPNDYQILQNSYILPSTISTTENFINYNEEEEDEEEEEDTMICIGKFNSKENAKKIHKNTVFISKRNKIDAYKLILSKLKIKIPNKHHYEKNYECKHLKILNKIKIENHKIFKFKKNVNIFFFKKIIEICKKKFLSLAQLEIISLNYGYFIDCKALFNLLIQNKNNLNDILIASKNCNKYGKKFVYYTLSECLNLKK